MEPKGSLSFSQQSAPGTYPEPEVSSPHAHIIFLYKYFNITLPPTPKTPKHVRRFMTNLVLNCWSLPTAPGAFKGNLYRANFDYMDGKYRPADHSGRAV
jgi:hypothetical protein